MSDSCNPRHYSHQGPLSMGFPAKKDGVGFHFLLQGTFLNQRSNLPLFHGRWILYRWATRKAHQIILSLLHLGHSALGKFTPLKGQLYALSPFAPVTCCAFCSKINLDTFSGAWQWKAIKVKISASSNSKLPLFLLLQTGNDTLILKRLKDVKTFHSFELR